VAELTSVEDWISAQIINIKQISDRPIVVRPHPRSKLDFSKLPNLTHGRPIKLEWVQRRESQQNFLSMGYDYSENCLIRDYVENIDVTAREHIEMRTQIFGRNLEVESIKQ
jgi:hypothetical protein